MGCLFSYQGMRMVAAYLVKVVVDGAAGMSGLQMLPFLGGTLVIAYPLGLWLSIKAEQLIAHVQSGISNELRTDLFAHLQTLSPSFFERILPGDVSSRFVTDIDFLTDGMGTDLLWLIANIRSALLLATSNRSEAAVGYATMDGDTCGGLSPIAGIDKAFLRQWLAQASA